MRRIAPVLALLVVLGVATTARAATITLTFTKLTGVVGGTPAATAVYRADLNGLGLTSILSLKVQDASFGLGGSPGQFTGFDLDAVKLSQEACGSDLASCAVTAGWWNAFDFSPAHTIFTPGTQRPPVDPKLFGTGPTGNTVDDTVATLHLFDGNSTTGPTADGFLSMGDGGMLAFNLLFPVPIDATHPLYLYIGEVGDNGEVAAASITVSDAPVPEPASLLLLGTGLASVVARSWRRRRG